MSKSKGNFYIIKDLLDKGHSPKALRYMLLSNHYRQQLNSIPKSEKYSRNSSTTRKSKKFFI